MPYQNQYVEFLKRRDKATGYDFGQGPIRNPPPPTLSFPRPLKWWSLDRPRRMRVLLRFPNQRLEEILRLRASLAVGLARDEGGGQTRNLRPGFQLPRAIHRELSNGREGKARVDERILHTALRPMGEFLASGRDGIDE